MSKKTMLSRLSMTAGLVALAIHPIASAAATQRPTPPPPPTSLSTPTTGVRPRLFRGIVRQHGRAPFGPPQEPWPRCW